MKIMTVNTVKIRPIAAPHNLCIDHILLIFPSIKTRMSEVMRNPHYIRKDYMLKVQVRTEACDVKLVRSLDALRKA